MRLKFYFDVMCPRSFTAFQLLKKHDLLRMNVDYRPIIRRKLLSRTENLANLVIPENEYEELGILRRTFDLNPSSLHYVDHRSYAVGKATLFLIGVYNSQPQLITEAMNEVMTRFWIEQLSVETAPSFMTISRKIGIQLRDSDILVSEIENRPNVVAMNEYLSEAVNSQQTDTPWLEIRKAETGDGTIEVISSLERLVDRIKLL